jgi:hypothetical protein
MELVHKRHYAMKSVKIKELTKRAMVFAHQYENLQNYWLSQAA